LDELVTFLFKNFQFVIIVIGIVYYLFFRKSPLERRSPNRMPDFGGEMQGNRQQPARPLPASVRPDRPYDPERRSAPAPIDAEPQRVRAPESETNPHTDDAPAEQAHVVRSNTPRAASRVLERQDLARAVLWSEILGRPRARKPYRR